MARRHGRVLGYPTEYCYGLGCDPRDRRAVRRILQLKQRPQHKGVIVIGSDVRQFRGLVDATALAAAAASDWWPGPNTLLLPVGPRCPPWLRGRHNTLAVRLTAHADARKACRFSRSALVSTSANRAGQHPVRHARELVRRFGRTLIRLPGRTGRERRPSRIIDWSSGRVLR